MNWKLKIHYAIDGWNNQCLEVSVFLYNAYHLSSFSASQRPTEKICGQFRFYSLVEFVQLTKRTHPFPAACRFAPHHKLVAGVDLNKKIIGSEGLPYKINRLFSSAHGFSRYKRPHRTLSARGTSFTSRARTKKKRLSESNFLSARHQHKPAERRREREMESG